MGGSMSSGQNNDELVDILRKDGYIKNCEVERVFRIVDRAHYYLEEHKDSAYKDLAWKCGTLHVSAPCIYSAVMEALELENGLSFLNLGSGTGYLSTMVGYMLGPYGINHGIELHEDNIMYAMEKLDDFKLTSKKFDDMEFCEPQFVVGNCLDLPPENRLYDRVYCGAACPPEQKEALQKLLKINGILVVPVGDQLLKIQRMAETEFSSASVLPVSFASLVLPEGANEAMNPVLLPEVQPVSLQFICSMTVREAIRKNFDFELPPPIEKSAPQTRSSQTRFFRRERGRYPLDILPTNQGLMIGGLMIGGGFNHSDEDDEDDDDSDDENNDDENNNDVFDILDRQLQQHALQLRRNNAAMRLNHGTNELNSDEIDSDISSMEENQEDTDGAHQAQENRNNQIFSEGSSFPGGDENGSSAVNSEDGVIADDEADPEDEKVINHCNEDQPSLLASFLKKKSSPCPSSDENDVANNIASTSTTNLDKESHSSLNEIADSISTPSSSPTKAVELFKNPLSESQPLPIKSSYSTSADTSETSGFGSLMEDLHPPSLPHSFDGNISDKSSSENEATSDKESSEEEYPALLPSLLKRKLKVPRSKLTEDISSDEDENKDQATKHRKSSNDDPMDTNEEDYDAEGSDVNNSDVNRFSKASDDEKMEEESNDPSIPRGPIFSVFLKEKIETLPIPNGLKAYILHYR